MILRSFKKLLRLLLNIIKDTTVYKMAYIGPEQHKKPKLSAGSRSSIFSLNHKLYDFLIWSRHLSIHPSCSRRSFFALTSASSFWSMAAILTGGDLLSWRVSKYSYFRIIVLAGCLNTVILES